MKKIILLGAGGHANSVFDVLLSTKKFKLENVLDQRISNKKLFNGFKIIKTDLFLKKNKIRKNIHFSFGSIYNLKKRHKLILSLKKKKIYNFPIIISPTSYVAKNVEIPEGSIITHNTLINHESKIHKHVVINTGSIIEHDVSINDNSHISTGVIVNGGVKIGKNCFVGSGSIIRENIVIPDNSFIKMGSIVKK